MVTTNDNSEGYNTKSCGEHAIILRGVLVTRAMVDLCSIVVEALGIVHRVSSYFIVKML